MKGMKFIKKVELDPNSDILLLTMDDDMVIGINDESIVLYRDEDHYYNGEHGLDGINICDCKENLK
jgi:hypothetical protein